MRPKMSQSLIIPRNLFLFDALLSPLKSISYFLSIRNLLEKIHSFHSDDIILHRHNIF